MSDLLDEVRARRRLPSPSDARAIRVAAGVSQSRLADELDVSRMTLHRWEAGDTQPHGEMLLRYLDLLEALESETGRAA